MGLDAVVYRNRNHLKLGADEELALVVPDTGEVYFESAELSAKHRHLIKALHFRLGNIAGISYIREEATRLIGPQSIILMKILYSGSHCGDFIPMESLAPLAEEINSINNASQRSPELQCLIISLQELIDAAKREGNPIVFV